MTSREVGDRLAQLRREKSAREHRDVTQAMIAEAVGLNPVTYSRYESGQRKLPEEAIEVLARYHGVTPAYIRYGIGDVPLATGLPINGAAVEALRRARGAKRGEPTRKVAGDPPRPGRPPRRK